MPRWKPDAAGRLQEAAIALFAAQGFERTTVAEIAARAGLTERTFFNHFRNKRDVLFGPTTKLYEQAVARSILAAPAGTPPLEAVVRGLREAADEVLETLHAPAVRRREVIDATPELREREEAKGAALALAIAQALCERGTEIETARLAAGAGLLIRERAEKRWTAPGPHHHRLSDLILESRTALRDVVNDT